MTDISATHYDRGRDEERMATQELEGAHGSAHAGGGRVGALVDVVASSERGPVERVGHVDAQRGLEVAVQDHDLARLQQTELVAGADGLGLAGE